MTTYVCPRCKVSRYQDREDEIAIALAASLRMRYRAQCMICFSFMEEGHPPTDPDTTPGGPYSQVSVTDRSGPPLMRHHLQVMPFGVLVVMTRGSIPVMAAIWSGDDGWDNSDR